MNPDGSSFPLPPMINRVPVLLLKPNHEILSGNQIFDYIKPQANTIHQEKTMLQNEPNPFSLNMDIANGYGVASDNFSFLDMGGEYIDFFLELKKNFKNVKYYIFNLENITIDFSKL